MKEKLNGLLIGLCLLLALCSCGASPAAEATPAAPEPVENLNTAEEEEKSMLEMMIGETRVEVSWEENESVRSLMDLCRAEPLRVSLSMYGGFEQVGPIGTRLPRHDVQTTTSSGDIVLYSGDQIVVFYGSNSWAYTRLGHITDQSEADMAELLGRGDVTLTLRLGESR